MPRNTKLLSVSALLLATALVASGCTGGSEDNGNAAVASLTIASIEPDHLTPGRTQLGYLLSQAVFSPLTFANPDGQVEMVAADSITSSDATTWTIKLKDGWTFHDGSPVTAESYVDSWNAVAYGPNAWAGNGSMRGIAGYADLNPVEGEPKTKTMAGLEVLDVTTFKVTLSTPDSQFPVQLSQNMPAYFPMPEAAFADPEKYDRQPIGNGPFKMSAPWQANDAIKVSAYEGFAGDKPGVKEYVFAPYTDMGAAYTDAQAGNVDILGVMPDKATVAPTDFPGLIHTSEMPAISYLAFPLNDPRYAKIKVRQAFSMAIDRESVSKAVMGGTAKPATAWTPPAEPGTPEGLCGRYCQFDPAAAKALLEEAGGFSGKAELVYPAGAGMDAEYTAYANQLRQNLGIEDVVVTPSTDFTAFLTARASGNVAGPYYSGWAAPYPSQQNTLRAIFTVGGACSGCSQGLDPEVEKALAAADSQLEPQMAQQGYAEAQKLIAASFPVAPLHNATVSFIASKRVADLATSGGYLVLPRIKAAS